MEKKKKKKSDNMSEMKLIMERWDKYLIEEEGGEVTIGDFFDAFAKYMPSTFSKIVGSSAAKIAVAGGVGLFATIATGGLGAVATVAAAPLINKMIDRLAGSGEAIAKAVTARAREQVPDDKRAGLDLYFDIDDGFENMIGGMDDKIGKEFIKYGLYVDYLDAFNQIKAEKERIETEQELQAFLAKPLREIGIDKTANELFKAMMRGEDGMELPSMDSERVAVKEI